MTQQELAEFLLDIDVYQETNQLVDNKILVKRRKKLIFTILVRCHQKHYELSSLRQAHYLNLLEEREPVLFEQELLPAL